MPELKVKVYKKEPNNPKPVKDGYFSGFKDEGEWLDFSGTKIVVPKGYFCVLTGSGTHFFYCKDVFHVRLTANSKKK